MHYLAIILLLYGVALAAPVIGNAKAPALAENRLPSAPYVHKLKRVPRPSPNPIAYTKSTTMELWTSNTPVAESTSTFQTMDGSKRAAHAESITSSTVDQANLINPARGYEYLARVTIGNQDFKLMIDTGSSDTWVHGLNTSDTFTPLDQHLNIGYLDKTWVRGIFGIDSVNIAGINVPAQQVAVAQAGNFSNGNLHDGLVGLSFPTNTHAFPDWNHSINSNTVSKVVYSSIINTIFENDDSARRMFSLALNRNSSTMEDNGGILAIGGMPDFSAVNVTSSLSSTPMINPEIDYTIAIDSITYGNETLDSGTHWIVDSGTSLMLVPAASAATFYDQFQPAGRPNGDGSYRVDCDAVPSDFAVTIAGQAFTVNPVDMISENFDGTCSGGIAAGDGSINILGDTFLKNVLVVFDWGNNEISFGTREYDSY